MLCSFLAIFDVQRYGIGFRRFPNNGKAVADVDFSRHVDLRKHGRQDLGPHAKGMNDVRRLQSERYENLSRSRWSNADLSVWRYVAVKQLFSVLPNVQ